MSNRLALASNTLLILVAAWAYAEREGLVLSLVLAICAIVNAYLIIKGVESRELSTWLSYTTNALLLAVGVWRLEDYGIRWDADFQIAALISIVGLINLHCRYTNNRVRSSTINKEM